MTALSLESEASSSPFSAMIRIRFRSQGLPQSAPRGILLHRSHRPRAFRLIRPLSSHAPCRDRLHSPSNSPPALPDACRLPPRLGSYPAPRISQRHLSPASKDGPAPLPSHLENHADQTPPSEVAWCSAFFSKVANFQARSPPQPLALLRLLYPLQLPYAEFRCCQCR